MGNVASTEAEEATELLGQQRNGEMLRRAALRSLASIPHMKENSLALAGDCRKTSLPTQYFVSIKFKFDAPVPCRITSFLVAAEDRATGCITSESDCQPGAAIMRDAAMGQDFPDASSSPESYHTISIPHISLKSLHNNETYCPLVIRIESLSSAASASGIDLASQPWGCALPVGMNAHTVFAKFRFSADGHCDLVVVHRRLWLNGTCLDLPFVTNPSKFTPQALEALLPSAAQAQGSAADRTDPPLAKQPSSAAAPLAPAPSRVFSNVLCVLCSQQPMSVVTLPCHHCCMCTACATEHKELGGSCPICCQPLQQLVPMSIPAVNALSCAARMLQQSMGCLPRGLHASTAPKSHASLLSPAAC